MSNTNINAEPIVAGMGIGSDSAPVVAPAGRSAPSGGSARYETHPSWSGGRGGGTRSFESGETNRLNQAHWQNAQDVSVNRYLAEKLSVIRARANYEVHNNGMLLGMINSHADDIVGPEGPTLQVISENDEYNTALEQVWRGWFAAPTPMPNVSGASWLKLNIRSLWKCGEYLSRFMTVPTDGPVSLRLRPTPPRNLVSPLDMSGRPDVFMGIRFDSLGRPAAYHLAQQHGMGLMAMNMGDYDTVPADLMIHEFFIEEEEQARGLPWLNTALQPSADLRDYDNQVQDAARQMADQAVLMYSEHPDLAPWELPEETTVERRTIKSMPPGWKPFVYQATQPPVQYPEYRAERSREFGRPMGIPLLMFRLDSAKHSYSSARLDTQAYRRSLSSTQIWFSGGVQGTGVLGRLVDEVQREARFSVPALKNRPEVVVYQWTWHALPHVDPSKEATADDKRLKNLTLSLSDAAASRGISIETHIQKLVRVRKLLEENNIPVPAELAAAGPQPVGATAPSENTVDDSKKKETAEAPPLAGITEQQQETSPTMTLNGAQIQAAAGIVTQVTEGVLPREAGIGQLEVLLNLSRDQAERVMGTVGKSFRTKEKEEALANA